MTNEQTENVQKLINPKFVHIHGHNRKIMTSPKTQLNFLIIRSWQESIPTTTNPISKVDLAPYH
jgi:hypothetical protein